MAGRWRHVPRVRLVLTLAATLVTAAQTFGLLAMLLSGRTADAALTFTLNSWLALVMWVAVVLAWLSLRRRTVAADWAERWDGPSSGREPEGLTGIAPLDADPRPHTGLTGDQAPPRRW